MNKFKDLYKADMARYAGNAEFYIKVFHFLHRKVATRTFKPLIIL